MFFWLLCREEELVRLSAQEFFGERALITNEVRKANVIAVGPVECLVLERSSFQSLLTDVQTDLVDAIAKRDDQKKPAEVEEVRLEVVNIIFQYEF